MTATTHDVISFRGTWTGRVITGGTMGETDARPATPAAQLHHELLGLGTVARLDRLQAALDAERRVGAAEALRAAAVQVDAGLAPSLATWLEQLAQQHLAQQQ